MRRLLIYIAGFRAVGVQRIAEKLSLFALGTADRDRDMYDISSFSRSLLCLFGRCRILWGMGLSPSLPGAKIGMARVDLKIVDSAALGSTVSSDGLTPSFLRLQCGAPLMVSACWCPKS